MRRIDGTGGGTKTLAAHLRPGSSQAQRPLVSVVMPCLNEVESVSLCVEEALSALAASGLCGEVIVVDNASTDGSAAAAMASGARVVREASRGYGSALVAGIAAARAEIVVMADADCTYDLSKIPLMVQPILDDEADVVFGSRLDGATRRTMPFLHRFIGTPGITYLIGRACGGTVVHDSQTGFRAFSRHAVVDLDLRSAGMEFASEMLIRASRAGLRVKEVSTGYRPRVGESKLNALSDGWRHLLLVLGLAPDVLLVDPGIGLLALGVILTMVSFVSPTGIALGSLRWQPVFFSTIALVLGTQALLAGTVLGHRLSMLSGGDRTRFAGVGEPGFPPRCLKSGVIAALSGVFIDLMLFAVWVSGRPAPSRGLVLASLAQGLLIIGASLVTFGILTPIVVAQPRRRVVDLVTASPTTIEPLVAEVAADG